MKVKELLKTVNVAWSPPAQHPILLAAGTAAQQLDASFNTSASLDLYSLNLQQPGYDMELKTSVSSDHRFYKIIWGSYGNNPAGIIVGGCDYGTIKIYSASKLLSNESDCLISSPDRHTGPVRAMDFNPFQANLLATGATESEIYIWDIVNTGTPMNPGSTSQPLEDVQHIAWNKQVQHILASTFSQRCVIWDLRKNEPIIKLSSTNSKVRWKVVQWHPEVATQLCLASEDDQAPIIELWDLRFATSPLKTFQDHQRGVLSIAWNPHDSDLLLSCAKDNRILCWNPSSEAPNGEVVCELAQTNQWNFDVSWCPRYPGLVVGTSFDGHAAVYSLLGGQYQASTETSNKIVDSFPGMDPFTQPPPTPQAEAAAILTKPPKWLRKPSGASFGFGGKLITFDTEPIDPNQPPSRKVIISQVITQPDLIKRSNELEEVLKTEQYKDYCKAKIDVANDEHTKNVWSCVDAYFNENLTKNLMDLLGYNSDEINNKLNQLAPPQDIVNDITEGVDNLLNGNVDGTAAFDAAIAQYNTDQQKKSTSVEKNFKINTLDDEDGLITQAILLGNLEAAVSLCFKSKRYADAIILSMAGGADLLARTQYRYFAEHSGALNALINSLVSENWIDIVKNSDIQCWKKVLVGIFTHSNPPERSVLCDMLGDRLFSCDDPSLKRKSQICYICSGNLNKMIEVTESGIQEIVELVIIMEKALEAQGIRDIQIEGNIARVLSRYAEMLASEGNLETALSYLSNSRDENVIMLKDRLCRALGYIEEARQNPAPMNIHQNTYSNPPQPQAVHKWNTAPMNVPYHSPQPQTVYKPLNANVQYPSSQYSQPSTPLQPQIQSQPAPPPMSSSTGTSNMNSNANSGSRPPSVGPLSKSKYIIDPSVKSSVNNPAYGRGGFQQNQMYNTPPSGSMMGYPQQQSQYQPPPTYLNQEQEQSTPKMYEPIRTQPQSQAPSYGNPDIPYQPLPHSSGWNDPPTAKSSRAQAKAEQFQPAPAPAPILHPLGGVAPQVEPPTMQSESYYPDPVYGQQYSQNISNMSNMPPTQNNPAPIQYNKPPIPGVPTATAAATSLPPSSSLPPARTAEAEKPKVPIPEQHLHLKTVFDELKSQCYESAKNPQTKRKIEDVSRKLEILYDCLREDKLSQNTLQGLHQISQLVQSGDYTGGLTLHTKLASGPDFSQIASFMPGIKVLLQSALQLGVFLR